MEITSREDISRLANKADTFLFIRKVLQSTYPLAIWRLPNSDEHYVLIDIRKQNPEANIENLNQCFVINPYKNSHPPSPKILCGDIIIKWTSHSVETQISPALSGGELDEFFEVTNSTARPEKQPVGTGAPSDYKELVEKAIGTIASGEAEKIVLARFEDYRLPRDFDPLAVYERLTHAYPGAFCHLTNTSEYGLWIGATPEKIIAIENNRYFSTDALAGTQPFDENRETLGQVAWTQKEIEEQAMVSRYIINCFKKIRLREYEELGPKTEKAGNLVHLKTEFKVDMSATNSPMLGSTMLNLMHPTSAVCGHPRNIANDFILKHEGYDRELFAGFLGPVGFEGHTRLFVNLRCMKVGDTAARLFAGAGITACSDPEKEFSETQHKMQTLLRVLDL